jgi:hypothetical protein
LRIVTQDLRGCIDAIQVRHRNVHHNDVGLEFLGNPDDFPSVGRFTSDFHVLLPVENKAQPFAHNSVVVCNHDPGLRHMASSTDDGISQRKEVP